MIRIDDRTGSKELARFFADYGITPKIARLDAGDFEWIGNGPRGKCAVVVERKRLDGGSSDLLQSMHSNRLSGAQLPKLCRDNDYGYLVVEGIWRPAADGSLEVLCGNRWQQRKVHCNSVYNYLAGLALRAGMLVWPTATARDTVAYIVSQYRMWTDKRWYEHHSHDVVYAPADPVGGRGFLLSWQPRDVPLVEKILLQFPGIGSETARGMASYFGTEWALFEAANRYQVEDWARVHWLARTNGDAQKVQGQAQQRRARVGEALARRIYGAIRRHA